MADKRLMIILYNNKKKVWKLYSMKILRARTHTHCNVSCKKILKSYTSSYKCIQYLMECWRNRYSVFVHSEFSGIS